jgi:hypothetical protein
MADRGADTDPRSLPQSNISSQVGARAHVNSIGEKTIVINSRTRIDDAPMPDGRERIHDGPCAQHAAGTNRRKWTDDGRWMLDSPDGQARRRQCPLLLQARAVRADRDHDAIEHGPRGGKVWGAPGDVPWPDALHSRPRIIEELNAPPTLL